MNSDDIVKKAYFSLTNYIESECSSGEDLMVKAYVELKKWIFTHRIVPGQKLIYQDLVDKLNMSKTPIIYALNRLEYEGFVERYLNRGYFVHEMDEEEASELFDAREAIEIFSLERGLENLTDANLKEIEKMVNYHSETDYGNMRKRLILDMSLHLKITQTTGNKFLIKMLQGLFGRLYLTYSFDKLDPGRRVTSEEEHRKFFETLKNKDMEAARALLQKHIRNGKRALTEGLQEYFPVRMSN